MAKTASQTQWIKWLVVAAAALALGLYTWFALRPSGYGDDFISGNGRIEAVEIDVAAKLGGRIEEILVDEGDIVSAGQPLAVMQLDVLNASRAEAVARHQQALTSVASAQAQVGVAESQLAAARASVVQADAELDAARRRLERSQALATEGASSAQELDDNRARVRGAEAALNAARAQVGAAQASVEAARTQVKGANALSEAAEATVTRTDADIADSQLKAPRAGRIQYRIAQPGEVVGAGGKIVNLVDLSDVYITFFLPETVAGRVAMGSDVRIILDAAPQYVIPAKVSYVASVAQFTPKTVETASERQKLMFRVRARISPELLERHLEQVKTGLPGIAWVRLDPAAEWPEALRDTVSTGASASGRAGPQ